MLTLTGKPLLIKELTKNKMTITKIKENHYRATYKGFNAYGYNMTQAIINLMTLLTWN